VRAAASKAALADFAQRLRRYRDDPVGFCRDVLEMDPHPGQERWLRDGYATENALVTGNRWGKSHVAAAKRVYKAVYRKGWTKAIEEAMRRKHEPYKSLNISITADQAGLVWQKAFGMLQGRKASWLVKSSKLTPFPTIEFVSGAVFEARSTVHDGMHILGHDYDDVNWDEAAYERRFLKVRDGVLRMRMADRAGIIDYTSTGNGRNDFGLYFLSGLPGEKKDPDLYSQSGPTYENPHINADRITKLTTRMNDRMRQQNIEGAIIDAGGGYFNIEDIEAAIDEALSEFALVENDDQDVVSRYVVRVDGGAKSWRDRYPSHRYLHGWDLADKQDWAVGTTWDLSTTPMTLVEFERFNKRGWDNVWARIRARQARYGTPKATKIDSTGIGDVAENELKDIQAEGVNFAGKKDALLTNLQTALSLREVRWPFIKPLVDEHKFYERDDDKLDTDCVMSCAVAMWFARRRSSPLTFTSMSSRRR
jgi:hypothetical protein